MSKDYPATIFKTRWTSPDAYHYYTKFLGMEDSISQDDRLIDTEAKTKLELELERERKTTSLIEERLRAQEKKLAEVTTQFEQINVFMNQLTTQDPSLIKLLTQKAKAHRIQL